MTAPPVERTWQFPADTTAPAERTRRARRRAPAPRPRPRVPRRRPPRRHRARRERGRPRQLPVQRRDPREGRDASDRGQRPQLGRPRAPRRLHVGAVRSRDAPRRLDRHPLGRRSHARRQGRLGRALRVAVVARACRRARVRRLLGASTTRSANDHPQGGVLTGLSMQQADVDAPLAPGSRMGGHGQNQRDFASRSRPITGAVRETTGAPNPKSRRRAPAASRRPPRPRPRPRPRLSSPPLSPLPEPELSSSTCRDRGGARRVAVDVGFGRAVRRGRAAWRCGRGRAERVAVGGGRGARREAARRPSTAPRRGRRSGPTASWPRSSGPPRRRARDGRHDDRERATPARHAAPAATARSGSCRRPAAA